MPELWIIAGPNGAGKSTLVGQHLRDFLVINPDEIASELSVASKDVHPHRGARSAVEMRHELLAARADFAIETTLTGNGPLQLMRSAKEVGYTLVLAYIGLMSVTLSIQRVMDRVSRGGHCVPLSAIKRRFPRALSNLEPAVTMADRSYIFDNSLVARRRLLIVNRGQPEFVSKALPCWVPDALPSFLLTGVR